MHTFQINVLIQFLASSTRFEHHVFIIRKTICTCSFVWYMFCIHSCMQSSRWKDESIEHILPPRRLLTLMYEKHTKLRVQMVFPMTNTRCSKHVEDAQNWIETWMWKVCMCWSTLHNCITMHYTKNIQLLTGSIFFMLLNFLHRTPVFWCLAEHNLGNDVLL
jgi:hypothetical protein